MTDSGTRTQDQPSALLDGIISRAHALRIDECEAALVKKMVTSVRMADSGIIEVKQIQDSGLCMRIIHNKRITAARLDPDQGVEFLDGLQGAPAVSRPREFWESLPGVAGPAARLDGMVDHKLQNMNGGTAADIAQAMINSAPGYSVSGSLNIVSEEFHLMNTNGLCVGDEATYIAGMINADASQNPRASGIGQQCCRRLDAFLPEEIGRDAARMCADSLHTTYDDSNTYTIILEPYSVGELLAFVAAPNFDHRRYSEGRSCFSGMIGGEVADASLTIHDDPHLPGGVGSKAFDDEGMVTRMTPLITNGILKGTYCNLYDAFMGGVMPTGNGLRIGSQMGRGISPSVESAPHNLCIPGGDMSEEEMIRETRHGLVIGRLWYTYAVNPIRGDFSCTARSGIRIIKNGEIVGAGRPMRILYSLPALLNGVSGVAKETRSVMQWASLPSNVPSIMVDGINAYAV